MGHESQIDLTGPSTPSPREARLRSIRKLADRIGTSDVLRDDHDLETAMWAIKTFSLMADDLDIANARVENLVNSRVSSAALRAVLAIIRYGLSVTPSDVTLTLLNTWAEAGLGINVTDPSFPVSTQDSIYQSFKDHECFTAFENLVGPGPSLEQRISEIEKEIPNWFSDK